MSIKDKKKSSPRDAQGNRRKNDRPAGIPTIEKKEIVTKVIQKIREL